MSWILASVDAILGPVHMLLSCRDVIDFCIAKWTVRSNLNTRTICGSNFLFEGK